MSKKLKNIKEIRMRLSTSKRFFYIKFILRIIPLTFSFFFLRQIKLVGIIRHVDLKLFCPVTFIFFHYTGYQNSNPLLLLIQIIL